MKDRRLSPDGGSLAARCRRNWVPVAARLKRTWPLGIDPVWTTAAVAVGSALIVLVGLTGDAAAAEWHASLGDWARRFFAFATRFGKSDWLLVPSGGIAVLVFFADWRYAGRAVAAAWMEIGAYAGVVFVAIAFPGIVADVVKPLVGRVRPNALKNGGAEFVPFTLGYAHASFPSGHATTMGALAVVAVATFGARSLPIVAAAAIVAVSRAMIGVHNLSDVVAGGLLGAGLAYVVVGQAAAAGLGFTARGGVRTRLGAARAVFVRADGGGRLLDGLMRALTRR